MVSVLTEGKTGNGSGSGGGMEVLAMFETLFGEKDSSFILTCKAPHQIFAICRYLIWIF